MDRPAVYLETFGCQMNELDSELVAGALAGLGYVFVRDAERAGVVLYNTCSVREQAEQKVWSRLGELAARKAREPGLVVGVLGCLAERDGAGLIDRMPVVDLMCGPGELDKLPSLLDNAVRTRLALAAEACDAGSVVRAARVSAREVALQGGTSRRSATLAAAEDSLELLDLSRAISPSDASGTARRSAYVRITRGCNKFCTYCVVPFTRGAEVHRPPEHILDECVRLADAGVIEITLLGQTVNHYRFEHDAAVEIGGVVQPQKGRAYRGSHRRDAFAGARVTTFADLLYRIHEAVPSVQRLRFVTSYPRDFGDDVLEVMRDCPRICRYLHAPAQSGSDAVLRAMNRGYSVSEYEEFIARAREYLDAPERPLMVSGDIIVGFPGESEADYEATVGLLERARYKSCFIFKYSPRPGTVAHDRLADDVPDAVKRRRNNHLLGVQARISDAISREQVGREFDVLVEGPSVKAVRASGASHGQLRKAAMVAVTVGGGAVREAHAEAASGAVAGSLLRGGGGGMVQMSARTDGDLIVFFDVPREAAEGFAGTIRRVRVVSADGLSMHGALVE